MDRAVVEIGEQIAADQAGEPWITHHVAADHRSRAGSGVLEERLDGVRDRALIAPGLGTGLLSLAAGPAEVRPGGRPGADPVDFLARPLADVADQEVAGLPIE
jgi:hypothetical protein